MRARAAIAACASIAVAWVAAAASPSIEVVEAVGVAAADASHDDASNARNAALRAGLAEAVLRVALTVLPDYVAPSDRPSLAESLGAEPLGYTVRYRILEDRGVLRDAQPFWVRIE